METKAGSTQNTISKSDVKTPAKDDASAKAIHSEALEEMNTSVNPCEDFYGFSLIDRRPIPDDMSGVDAFGSTKEHHLQQYTKEQIFMASNAQQVLTGVHSPEVFRVFRVHGVFSNMEAFAKVFNCPPNSLLNPNHKCSVW